MSLNPALLKDCFRPSMSAKAKGPGVDGGGAGAFICFLTEAKAKSSHGTFEGADHTAAESLPFITNISLILTSVAERFGKNIRPHLERIALNFAVESGKSIFSPSLSLNSMISSKPSDLALVFAINSIREEMSIARTLPFGLTLLAAVTAGSPIPVAISNTLSPGWTLANSTSLLLTFCALRSMVSHQVCQPAAALSHISRC